MDEKQKTFGPIVGMDSTVPTTTHNSDTVECVDGVHRPVGEVYRDCRGNAYADENDARDSNVEIVTEILMAHDESVTAYTTENTDYPSDYASIVDECHYDWNRPVSEWVNDNYEAWSGNADLVKKITSIVCEDMEGSDEVEAEYSAFEYEDYSGNGCCLFSFAIDEYENQIEIALHNELQELHNNGNLDDVLDSVNCDVGIIRHKKRVKNEKNGNYEEVGRDTYDTGSSNPSLMAYHQPGGQWEFVVSTDRMRELVTLAIITYLRRA